MREFFARHKIKLLSFLVPVLLAILYYYTNKGAKVIDVEQQFAIKPEWWNRPITQVSLPGTHNSYNTGFKNTNVDISIEDQIKLGVRFFEIDVYDDGDKLSVYHGVSWTGKWDFEDILNTLAIGIQEYPTEIFFMKIERHADQQKVQNTINRILGKYIYRGKEGEVPTVQELIDTDKRLITTGSAGNMNAPLTYRGTKVGNKGSLDLLWEPYVYRGEKKSIEPQAGLRLTAVVLDKRGRGVRSYSQQINTPTYLKKLAIRAWRLNGRIPGQVIVDFPSLGNVFKVVNELNENNRLFGTVEVASKNPFEDGDIQWICIYEGGEYKEEITTFKLSQFFDLPAQIGEKMTLRPVSEKYNIIPESIAWHNEKGKDTLVTFTLKDKTIHNN
ncbi:phosphatidylinositol-specific phospholipase C domain-containing protein [Tamlana sp. 2201CG12-4]|uniref:phosphatidylinositol-specific phospholipase C domain-containing protein n=1 Tax=Tamlana sp. 2201CG12-4 TaxID=3112582 RepID=UPI002DBC26D2|nr:phosphatidylinositol-specific phospholipase C domain-containing protein [Tamlana sp. 2201CG12-4]MEC3908504.1 phosphatidylinositol-specific phospholipase C domain-containing protein [Tamlana sp. 2201CG12-4]